MLLHPDYTPFQAPDRIIAKITGQYAWNIYLSDPQNGEVTTVYNRPWLGEQDDKLYPGKGYGYDAKVVENCESASFNVNAGKLVFFNSRNFHEVTATAPRVSVGGHLGLTLDNKIIGWS